VNLKTQTDYALRTLLYLGFVGEKATVDAIAQSYQISREHLVKVVQQLVRMGYVRSQAGRTGGVRLAKPAEQIVVGQVVADFEGRNGVLGCVTDPTYCVLEPGCLLRHLLIEAEQAFYERLGKVTVADLLKTKPGAVSGGLLNLTVRPRGVAVAGEDRQGGTVG
jgi:Rrf2 family nitric oxide-sensitive transcriptional repressor